MPLTRSTCTCEHGLFRACAVSDRVGDVYCHKSRLRLVPAQASIDAGAGDATGTGPPCQPQKHRSATNPQRGVKSRLGPQRWRSHRLLFEAAALEKARAIRTAYAQLKESKSMKGKGDSPNSSTVSFPSRPCFRLGRATRASPPSPECQRQFRRLEFLNRRLRLRQRVHERGLRRRKRPCHLRAEAIRPHERAVPSGTRGGVGAAGAARVAATETRGFPEGRPRRFDFHELPAHDIPPERVLQVRQVGLRPPVLAELRMHTRGSQLSGGVAPAVHSLVAINVRRSDPRLLTGRECKYSRTTVR